METKKDLKKKIVELKKENIQLKSKLHIMELEEEVSKSLNSKAWFESLLLNKYKELVEQYEEIINKKLNQMKEGD